jgi:hypothetical protein
MEICTPGMQRAANSKFRLHIAYCADTSSSFGRRVPEFNVDNRDSVAYSLNC